MGYEINNRFADKRLKFMKTMRLLDNGGCDLNYLSWNHFTHPILKVSSFEYLHFNFDTLGLETDAIYTL